MFNVTFGGKAADIRFDWIRSQRRFMLTTMPVVLMRLKQEAPVSATKSDAGRLKDSIGVRFEVLPSRVFMRFVSTAPYAQYVLDGTTSTTFIAPKDADMLRYVKNGDYVFAHQVRRGQTKPNYFPERVRLELTPFIQNSFANALVIVSTPRTISK